ncbi:TldD/PmbA family protein [Thermococcus paralvinellae]|uniref:TldD protein, part of TldE/TldD proteolytic complex n=1 Tax=Thermococcus paralvinellae TaxID=582419 RepID=W0I6W6_9EURY|nr:TldD/PmbA family protein [Thermococcus paralvinellae]AHF80200.1 TldD protein, part of TldE/TldD proteolytic complex [Thermococcus paralvinellae]
MQDVLEKALEWAMNNLKAEYIELRYENLKKTNLELKDGTFVTFTNKVQRGVAIRVLADGAWGFSSTNRLENLEKAIEEAYKLAKAGAKAKREKIQLAEIKPVEDVVKSKMKIKPAEVNIDDKIGHLKELEKLLKEDKVVKSTMVRYEDASGEKILLTNEGTNIRWDVNYLVQYIWATGKEGDKLAASRDSIGQVDYGWEIFETKETNEAVAQRVLKKLHAQLNGVAPKRGEFPIVAGPIIVGIIAHEALGHLAEADLTINSPFKDLMGKQIAPEFVTMSERIVDGGFGNDKYDDEGVPVRDIHIIENGILKELMVNREYAHKWGIEPNGHARAQDYTFPPIIRMRNTVFEPGDWSFEEMIEDIKFGYYVVDFRGGQAQLNSAFQVGVQEGYMIENGEITKPIRDTSISGIAIEALKKITAVGKDFGIETGFCGKGQTAFVSSGGPHMRFDRGIIIG